MANYKDSRKQEKDEAKTWDGTVNAGSGNGWLRKNDVRTPRFSIEDKVTSAKQFTLRDAELRKAEKYALLDSRIMLFGIRMCERDWYVVSKEDFIDLVGDQ